MPPAARVGDLHVCTQVTGVVPHVGGPIAGPGAATVLINSMPASIVGDTCVCVGPPDKTVKGSGTVMLKGKPAVRLGDQTDHGGTIVLGSPTVLIGG
ncbi:MAG: PAAR domain-containing protein [Planctomycetaceae bacterium]|nr:PAAR domain-containing protein [Planctomycetaceae bacterium]